MQGSYSAVPAATACLSASTAGRARRTPVRLVCSAAIRFAAEIFDQLNERLQASKKAARKALEQARAAAPKTPEQIREKIARLSDALNALEDDTVPVPLKNDYLKAVIERIDYYRPAAVRKRSDGSEPKVHGGWYTPPFELDVRLKI